MKYAVTEVLEIEGGFLVAIDSVVIRVEM